MGGGRAVFRQAGGFFPDIDTQHEKVAFCYYPRLWSTVLGTLVSCCLAGHLTQFGFGKFCSQMSVCFVKQNPGFDGLFPNKIFISIYSFGLKKNFCRDFFLRFYLLFVSSYNNILVLICSYAFRMLSENFIEDNF